MAQEAERKTVRELADTFDQDLDVESEWMPSMPGGSVPLRQSDPPRLHEIVKLLRSNPILVEPTLNNIQDMMAAIQRATLNVLYTDEQQAALRERFAAQINNP